jgi:hypothetical protein
MTATHQATSNTATQTPTTEASTHRLRRRWPTVAGVALAALTGIGLASGVDLAPIVAASGLVYLGAAVLERPVAAWHVFLGTFVVLTVTKVAGADAAATWVLLGIAALFAGYGLIRRRTRRGAVPLQTIAMVVFGATAAAALIIDGTVGGYLVAAGLFGHAAWDAYHHRINRVVVRSMAEFCFVLDTLLALTVLILTARG